MCVFVFFFSLVCFAFFSAINPYADKICLAVGQEPHTGIRFLVRFSLLRNHAAYYHSGVRDETSKRILKISFPISEINGARSPLLLGRISTDESSDSV